MRIVAGQFRFMHQRRVLGEGVLPLLVFPGEIILIDPFDRIPNPGAHADLVDDHEAREFLPVDQDDAVRCV